MGIRSLVERLEGMVGVENAKAHCDIPCGIYDPSSAQLAALTVLRMVDLIEEIEQVADGVRNTKHLNSLVRFVTSKEDHAIAVKDEVRVIWGDYFKTPQFERFPEIHALTHKIMLLASAAKQHVDRDKALELIEAVNRFAEIFWATKDVAVKRAVCPYPPSVEIVYPDL